MRSPASYRRLLLLAVSALLLSPAAFAHGPKIKKAGKRDLRAEALVVDEQWRKSLSSNDSASMDKLLADDYLGISGNGQVMTKLQQLDRMRNHTMQINSLTVDDVKAKLIGQHVVVITSSAVLEGTIDARKIQGRFQSTRIYQRIGGQWRITNFEATPLRPYPRGGRED